MDNARWFVILSVVFSMMVTLTLLNRYAGIQLPKLAIVSQPDAERPVPITKVSKPVVNLPTSREVPRYNRISFPKPAAHTLTID